MFEKKAMFLEISNQGSKADFSEKSKFSVWRLILVRYDIVLVRYEIILSICYLRYHILESRY